MCIFACWVQVQLMVTEHMRAVLELDERLKVVKADPVVGQMLGLMSTNEMRGQYVYKCVLRCPNPKTSSSNPEYVWQLWEASVT